MTMPSSRGQTWTRSSSRCPSPSSPAARRPGQTWTRRALGVLAAALVPAVLVAGPAAAAAAVPAATAAPAGTSQHAGRGSSWVLTVEDGRLAEVRRAVTRLGGTVTRELPAVGVLAVRLPAGTPGAALTHLSGVRGVSPDGRVHLAASSTGGTDDAAALAGPTSVTALRTATGTDVGPGHDGSGIAVALVDSGVTTVPGLTGGTVVQGPDLSFDGARGSALHTDGLGHGTAMAGLIAADQGPGGYQGVAPGATVLSVKVADASGAADVTQVIAGIDWVVAHPYAAGVRTRVLNLSFGTDSDQDYLADPLAYAAERAWLAGIVVVVSAGNTGTTLGHLTDPATDPYVIAVGASDTQGTPADPSDDTVAPFSARGSASRAPDLLAPGVGVPTLRVAGSTASTSVARAGSYLRGSGTSESAAVVSGVVADLLDARPGLRPDQVKALLTGTATRLDGVSSRAQGAGLLDAADAAGASVGPAAARQRWARSAGDGTLEGARGSVHVVVGGRELRGEQDLYGDAWSSTRWAARTWASTRWASDALSGSAWASSSWAGTTWASSAWASSCWASSSWASSAWAGSAWAGSAWAGSAWAGESWA